MARGFDVTLVAAPGSHVADARVVCPLDAPPRRIATTDAELMHALAGAEALPGVDLVLDHSGALGATIPGRPGGPPVVHVAHGPLEGMALDTYRAVSRSAPRVRMIALSDAQRRRAPELPFAGVCPDGIDLDAVPMGDGDGGYLAFLGRMAPRRALARRSRSRAASACRW